MRKRQINFPFHNVDESFKKFLDLDPDVDDFQNLTISISSTDISVKVFTKSRSVVPNRQTNRKINK